MVGVLPDAAEVTFCYMLSRIAAVIDSLMVRYLLKYAVIHPDEVFFPKSAIKTRMYWFVLNQMISLKGWLSKLAYILNLILFQTFKV